MNLLAKAKHLKIGMNLWPPLVGAGISIRSISDDFTKMTVEMKLRWYNRNYKFTHFGGSLFAMTDPFIMMMFMGILGKEYVVWDKSASIDFIKPGKGTVSVNFHISQEIIAEVYEATKTGNKYFPKFEIDILDEDGEVVAKVIKTIYIRKKRLNK